MAEPGHILLVEDEESMVAGLRYALEREGYRVTHAADGAQALGQLGRTSFDLVLLDVMMPKRSGFDVLDTLRREGRELPVILLTAKTQEVDKVHGLDLGADDYVTKPFSLAELLARIRVRLKRRRPAAEDVPQRLELGETEVDLGAMIARRGGEEIALTVREADMLRLLWRERGRAVSRQMFLDRVWGHERFPTTRTVDQHVAKLRQKVEENASEPRFLLTVFGVGYRLEA